MAAMAAMAGVEKPYGYGVFRVFSPNWTSPHGRLDTEEVTCSIHVPPTIVAREASRAQSVPFPKHTTGRASYCATRTCSIVNPAPSIGTDSAVGQRHQHRRTHQTPHHILVHVALVQVERVREAGGETVRGEIANERRRGNVAARTGRFVNVFDGTTYRFHTSSSNAERTAVPW